MAQHALYRFYSATGQLLYVGITANPSMRFRAHRHTKDWWPEVVGITLENYATREDLAKAERRAIQVEHPLHNVVHTKRREAARPQPMTDAPPIADEPAELTDDELANIANLFKQPSSSLADLLPGLFGGQRRRETCYGYVTDEEYEERVKQDRAKAAARAACPFCDSAGYRNLVVCDHADYGDAGSARREAQKRQLRVVEGGAV